MYTENIGERDRWLIDGDCNKCRRQNYCSKPCKLHGVVKQQMMAQAFAKTMVAAIYGAIPKKGDDY